MRQAFEHCQGLAAALPQKPASTKAYAANVPPIHAPPSASPAIVDSETIAAPSPLPSRPTIQPMRETTDSGKDLPVTVKPKMPVAIWVFLGLLVTAVVGGGVVVAWYFGVFGGQDAKSA